MSEDEARQVKANDEADIEAHGIKRPKATDEPGTEGEEDDFEAHGIKRPK